MECYLNKKINKDKIRLIIKMPDYSKSKIYLIKNKNNDNLIYVGSTTEHYLSTRFNKHKAQQGCSLYQYINNPDNESCWNDWYIELYEEFKCENKLQLCKKENEIIRQLATINKIGYRTEEMKKEQEKEYREKNKERIAERDKKYKEQNRDKILETKKQYNETHKEYKKNYMKIRYQEKKDEIIQKSKEYRENNKEIIKQRKKEYYENNKDYINEKIQCSCGCLISRKGIREHERTKKHLESTKEEQTNH